MSVQLFWVDRIDNTIVASLLAPLTAPSASQVATEINSLFQPDAIEAVVIELKKGTRQVSSNLITLLGAVKRLIRETRVKLKIAGADDEVIQFIRSKGLSTDIEFIASLEAIKRKQPPSARPKIDVSFVNPVISATLNVFNSMAKAEVKLGKPSLRRGVSQVYDVAVVLSLNVENFKGDVVIGMDLASYRSFLSQALEKPVNDNTDDLVAGADKFLNALYNESKRHLEESGHTIRSAAPALINAYQVSEYAIGFVIPMAFDGGALTMEIVGTPSRHSNNAAT